LRNAGWGHEMTEEEIRTIVRETIAQYVGGTPVARQRDGSAGAMPVSPRHSSHVQFSLPSGEGACLIEPAVVCTHCGYCTSYGH
jgi:hypothetical protein